MRSPQYFGAACLLSSSIFAHLPHSTYAADNYLVNRSVSSSFSNSKQVEGIASKKLLDLRINAPSRLDWVRLTSDPVLADAKNEEGCPKEGRGKANLAGTFAICHG